MSVEKSEVRALQSGKGMKQGSSISASVWRDCQFARNDGVLSSFGICRRVRARRARARFCRGSGPAPGTFHRAAGEIGFWQQRRARLCAVKRSYLSAVLLWTAVVLVVAMIVFPQEIAGFIADHLQRAAK